jgi:hypothetical protein
MIRTGLRFLRRLALVGLIALPGVGHSGTLRTADVPFRPDIRALGMGGAYVAAGRNGSAFLYNPALLVQSHTDISLPFSLGVDKNTIDVFNFINDHQEEFKNFSDLSVAEQQQLYNDMAKFDGKKIRVRINPMFNLVFKNFGLAAFYAVRAGAVLDRGIFEPRIGADGRGDLVVAGGFAKHLTPKFSLGANLKIINSRSTDFQVRVTQAGKTFDTVLDSLKKSETGVGLDIGGLYELSERTTLGFAIQDFYGKVGDDKFPINVKGGIAWRLSRITLAADITDLLNRDGVSLFNRVYMGGEFRLPLVSLRAGFYQGYPSLGAGLNLKLLKFDYAYYKVESAGRPGIDGRGQHEAQIKIGWGW